MLLLPEKHCGVQNWCWRKQWCTSLTLQNTFFLHNGTLRANKLYSVNRILSVKYEMGSKQILRAQIWSTLRWIFQCFTLNLLRSGTGLFVSAKCAVHAYLWHGSSQDWNILRTQLLSFSSSPTINRHRYHKKQEMNTAPVDVPIDFPSFGNDDMSHSPVHAFTWLN